MEQNQTHSKSSALEGRIELAGNGGTTKNKSGDALKPIEPIPDQTAKPTAPARRLPWWSIVGVLALLLLAVTVWKSLGSITISSNPEADKITVNGKQIQAGKKLLRLPGMGAKVTIEKQGYVTFDKSYKFGYSTELTIAPKLKQFPPATLVSKDVSAPVVLDKDSDGIKALNTSKDYILKISRDTQKVRRLNLEAIADINNLQFPADQNFALLELAKETGVLDFARVNVTSQGYRKFANNILSIALSPNGKETFYMEHNDDTNQNYLVRDDIRHETPDRYFDEAQLKSLGLSKPNLKWSPNGKTVMAIDKQIVLIDLLNRKADKIILGSEVTNAWFVPNSSIILAVTFDKKLLSFDASKIPADSGQDANPPAKTSYLHAKSRATAKRGPAWSGKSIAKVPREKELRTLYFLPSTFYYSVFAPTFAYAADDKADLGLVDHGTYIKPETLAVVDNNNIVAINNQNQLIGYNFTLKKQVTYLLGKGVDAGSVSAVTVDAKRDIVYLLVGNTLYSQALESNNY